MLSEPLAMQSAIAHQNGRGLWLYKRLLRRHISDFFSSATKTLPRRLFADAEIRRWNASAAGLDLLQWSACRSGRSSTEQRLPRGMDAPPAHSSGNLGSLWQSSSRPLRRQFSLTNLFHKGHGCPGLVFFCSMLSLQIFYYRRYSGESWSNGTSLF